MLCLTVSDAAINLGMLHTDRLLYLDDKETSEFAYKLIEYALLREEVRRDKKKDKTQGCHRWTCSKNEVTQSEEQFTMPRRSKNTKRGTGL